MSVNGLSKPLGDIIGSLPCGYETWSTIWGDPILSGTVLMIGHAITGLAVYLISRRLDGRERILWFISAVMLFLLVLNTHLDFQAFVWSYGKCLSQAQGWYENRHAIQLGMIVAGVCVLAAFAFLILVYFRRNLLRNLVLLIGMSIVVGITVLEAIDYGRLERYYAMQFGAFGGDDLIELFGMAVVLLAVMLRRRHGQDAQN